MLTNQRSQESITCFDIIEAFDGLHDQVNVFLAQFLSLINVHIFNV